MGWTDKLKKKKDGAKGAAKELGKPTDDEQMERKGQIDQTKSNLKQAGENVTDALNKDLGWVLSPLCRLRPRPQGLQS